MKAAESRVLLTGASGGIGTEIASALVKEAGSVMLVGRSPARLGALARTLAASHHAPRERVEWYAADLSDADALGGLASVAAEWRCNVVVHNAGVPAFGRLESIDATDMAKTIHLNLLVPMLLTQRLLPHLKTLPESRIICIGSALGRLGLPGFSVYGASKFGLRGFAESLRRELGDSTVRVQYLGPRSTRTSFNGSDVERFNQATGTAMDPPQVVARALLRLLDSRAPERFVGFPEKLAVRLNGVIPGILDGAFAKHRRALHPSPGEPAIDSEVACASGRQSSHSLLNPDH